MSLKTWKAEFYPTPAHRCSKKNAVEHSLRKWIGLRPANLKKHGVALYNTLTVSDTEVAPHERGKGLDFDVESCSLCAQFYMVDGLARCVSCPLFKARGGVQCYELRPREETDPYWAGRCGNPEPMIRWLKKARDHQ